MMNSKRLQRKSIRFRELVPDIGSLYSIQDIQKEASLFNQGAEGAGDMALIFDCSDFTGPSQPVAKDPGIFLPWCFLRCVDVAGRLRFGSIQLVCDEKEWICLEPVWMIASAMGRDLTIVRR
jgi:hypothetical protein